VKSGVGTSKERVMKKIEGYWGLYSIIQKIMKRGREASNIIMD
jgi:hypothetical protein